MTTAPARNQIPSSSAHRVRARALGVVGATLAALAGWTLAVLLLGVDLSVRPGGGTAQTVGAGSVVAVSLAASLLGWALLAVLERRSSRALTVWTGVALGILLLSMAGPLTAAITTSGKAALVALHLAVAAVLIPTLRRTSPLAMSRPEGTDDTP